MLTKSRLISISTGVLVNLFLILCGSTARAYETSEATKDLTAMGLAYSTHIFFHELGHQVVADKVGAENHTMSFMTRRNGQFYFGLSTYESIPKESKLAYAAGGHCMEGYTFEYALQSYRNHPTAFNKALMFFSNTNFLLYTLYTNYEDSNTLSYDPNLIRRETGCSKDLLIGMILAQSLMNTYRIFNKDAHFVPYIKVDKDSAAFMVRVHF